MSEEAKNTDSVANAGSMGLTTNDIVNTVKIIDICVQRGAVRGDELSSVGNVRDRLVAFIQSLQPAEAPAE